MAFTKVCGIDDVWEGEMLVFDVGGHDVLVLGVECGEFKAYQGTCPHQEMALAEGQFDGKTLICRAHQWSFDACTGRSINPDNCQLAAYPIRIQANEIYIDTVGVTPVFASV